MRLRILDKKMKIIGEQLEAAKLHLFAPVVAATP
jgi:hypothetical protein